MLQVSSSISDGSLDRLSRARGALLGLACGDAVGTTVEFKPRGSFPSMIDMVGGGPFNLIAGQWTDDTSMALCLASSLIENGFDLLDQMNRYVRWYDEGYMSSNGRCFDVGNATYDALIVFKRTGQAQAGSFDSDSAGNGSIMRLAPVPIRYLDTPKLALDLSEEQSRTTHQSPECLMACRLLGEVLIRALLGKSKDEVLAPSQQALRLSPGLRSVAIGGYKTKTRDQVRGSGYVVQSLEAALWCFWSTDNFKDAIQMAANLGDDADTTAAVTGQIAGAFYGEAGIPAAWLEKLTKAKEIRKLADQLVLNNGNHSHPQPNNLPN
jgi:ADP-ribosyl-[dinitrogen reductase] hydrolase